MISSTSEYALRALVTLADIGGEKTMLARELAKKTNVPPSYLYKILTSLRRAGLLAGTRGNRGGYRLARRPEEIHLMEVVSLFEVIRPVDTCVLGRTDCSDDDACGAHGEWKRIRHVYHDFLTTKTIADLTEENSESK